MKFFNLKSGVIARKKIISPKPITLSIGLKKVLTFKEKQSVRPKILIIKKIELYATSISLNSTDAQLISSAKQNENKQCKMRISSAK